MPELRSSGKAVVKDETPATSELVVKLVEAPPPEQPVMQPTDGNGSEGNGSVDALRDDNAFALVRDAVMFSPPPPFRGQPGEDFQTWLKKFNRWGLCCHYSDLRKCEILPVLLEGRAENIYDAVPKEVRGNYK